MEGIAKISVVESKLPFSNVQKLLQQYDDVMNRGIHFRRRNTNFAFTHKKRRKMIHLISFKSDKIFIASYLLPSWHSYPCLLTYTRTHLQRPLRSKSLWELVENRFSSFLFTLRKTLAFSVFRLWVWLCVRSTLFISRKVLQLKHLWKSLELCLLCIYWERF